MGQVKTTIELKDKMSQVLNKINQNLNAMMLTMQNTSDTVDNGFDTTTTYGFKDAIYNVQSGVRQLNEELNKAGNSDPFNKLSISAVAFGNVVGNIITKVGEMTVSGINSLISGSLDQFNESKRAYAQLNGVLNKVSSNALKDFEVIDAKASEISMNGMFDKDAMIAAAGEFATYFSDSNAMASMMDTLSNYAAGMSQGKQVDSSAMVDYATNIAKLTTGAYDAMTKKGFEVNDAQKAILKGTATQSQLVQELGANYNTMTEDMQKATVINSIIEESWGNMYDTMSNTPEGQIAMLINDFKDLQITIGASIYSGIQPFIEILRANMPTIETMVRGFASVLSIVMNILARIADVAFKVARVIIDNFSIIGPIIMGVVGAFLAYQMILALATIKTTLWAIATTIANGVQWLLNGAMYACPLVWIIALIAIVIGAIIAVANWIAKVTGIAGSGFGVIVGGLMVVVRAVQNVISTIMAIFQNMWIGITNIIKDLQAWFWGLLETVMNVVVGIAEALNKLPFINFDVEGLKGTAASFAEKKQAALDSKEEYVDVLASWKGDWVGEAFSQGAKIGDGLSNGINNMLNGFTNPMNDPSSLINQTQTDIADNTGSMAESLGSNDELEYLKDLAQQETINRFTTAEIRVNMGGISQNISKDTDADGVVDYLVNSLEKSMSAVAEGVY